jgi:hypothetical protein
VDLKVLIKMDKFGRRSLVLVHMFSWWVSLHIVLSVKSWHLQTVRQLHYCRV